MALVPINSSGRKCRTRGGISKMYITEADNILTYDFDADHVLQSIAMDTGQPDPTWKRFTFEKDTAFFTQPKTVPGGVNVAQTISFVEPEMSAEIRKALYLLNQECAVHALVLTNSGKWMLFGVSYYPEDDNWVTEDMSTGEGSGDSGDNPAETRGQYIETLVANVNFYAPFSNVAESSLAVAA